MNGRGGTRDFGSSWGGGGGGGGRGSGSYRNSQPGGNLRKPDWDRMQLQPFQKNFYQEHPNTTNRPMSEVDAYRQANEITVKGREVHKPILRFEEGNFPGEQERGLHGRRRNGNGRTWLRLPAFNNAWASREP